MGFNRLILPMLMHLVIALMLSSASTLTSPTFSIARPGCQDHCGNVSIPFPFGITEGCYLNKKFFINCINSSTSVPQPVLRNSTINVTDISLEGQVYLMQYIASDCYNENGNLSYKFLPWMRLSKRFTFNSTANKFIVVGCDAYGIVYGFGQHRSYATGCVPSCYYKEDVIDGSCSGIGCCRTDIPPGAWNITVNLTSLNNHTKVWDFNPCSYAFVVEEKAFNFSADNLTNLSVDLSLPVVADWTIEDGSCEVAQRNTTSYACSGKNSHCYEPFKGLGYRCSCDQGYEGNPYLPDGCQDIDECQKEETNNCKFGELCINVEGGYNCSCTKGYLKKDDGKGGEGCTKKSHQALVAGILAGVAVGTMVLLVVCSWCLYVSKKRKMMWLKEKFFRENGGLLLQKRLNGQEESSNSPRIFSARDLEKATNNFHEGNIIGQGGFGIVYKGRLIDNKEVAIKKSKTVDPNQIEQFINEVVILSQINHKNVVKLFGCCLETEVPLLVYEFINNDTLFNHLHNKKRAREISWDIRLKIGAETAEALSYLHSAASPPIIHRDIKTTNILLDEEFTAKVSDFGASRVGLLDQDQLSTVVQGTRGYLDPEFFQTFQLTEKSDVYSFGVVLVELLTGKKPVCFNRSEGEISLSNHFLSSMKENRLFQILEDSVASDENIDQLRQVAVLAERCLNVKGADRPSMKEVAMELVGLRITSKHTRTQGSQALNQEEIEPLIDHQEQSNPSGGGDIMLTTTYYSLPNQEIQPIAHGR
ncbi:wall-associated receptor kinase 3-like [Coffea arabica]|uniref:Wall-associated receptor kinase 3-like n=1 Tax=Coffea arabica TaxID=13443 RepID=A0A6P6UWJ1_COFAR|nr:wall-associated receptor kinase 3-like [Coffea arabica]